MYIAKRIFKIIAFMVLAGIIYAVGAYVPPDYSILITPPPPPPPTYLPDDDTDPVYTELGAPAVIEYGAANLIINNNNPFHAYIRYPQAGNPADAYIQDWAEKIFGDMYVHYSTGVEFEQVDFGEMNIQFNSYLIDNRYAGIHQYGEYSFVTTQPSQEILKTFNIDLTEFKHLEPGEILNLEEPDAVLSLLSLRLLVEHPKTDGYHIFIDETWLSYLLITHEGIVVFLPHNEFLPDNFETLTVTLPYEDLGSSLLIRRSAPLPAMPTPAPEPTPTPKPTPAPASDPDSDADAGNDTDTDSNAGADSDADTDSDADDDSDADTDSDADDNTGADSDADSASDDEPPPTPSVPPQSGPIDPAKPAIALSFEDGPGMYTDELLDLLEQYNVRATFFITGNLAHTRSEILERAVELNCEVAGHSWNHKNLAKMNANDVKIQIETTQSAIETITGTTVPIFRPPYGAVSDTMKAVSEEMGLSMINWNLDSEDWKGKDADQIYELLTEQVKDRTIILSHDIYGPTLEAYKRLIPELLLKGYQITTVSQMIKLTNKELLPGQVYYTGEKLEVIS